MNYLIQFQINVYALFVLSTLLVVIHRQIHVDTTGKRILQYGILLTMLAVIVEPLSWIFDGTNFFGSYLIEYGTNVLLFLLAPMIVGIMFAYVKYHTEGKQVSTMKLVFGFHFTILTGVILFLNIFIPIYFSIPLDTNSYHKEDYVYIHYALVFGSYLYILFYLWRNRSQSTKEATTIFTIFFFLPIIGIILQLINSHLYFSWTSISLSIFMIFATLETSDGEHDYLTKLFNRFSYEKYTKQLIEQNATFYTILFDLDNFKQINDTYGHITGDSVLIAFAEALKQSLYPNKMIARIGGDEYIAIIEDDIQVEDYINAINEHLASSKDNNISSLKFSYGAYAFTPGMTIDEVYHLIDMKMYEFKRINKGLRRRQDDANTL